MSIFIYTGAIIGGMIINETIHYVTSIHRTKYNCNNINVGYINVDDHVTYEPFEYISTDKNGIEINNECKINNDIELNNGCKINNNEDMNGKKNIGFNFLKDIQKFDVSSLHSIKNKTSNIKNDCKDNINNLSLFDELKLRLKQKRSFIHTEFNTNSNDNKYNDFDD